MLGIMLLIPTAIYALICLGNLVKPFGLTINIIQAVVSCVWIPIALSAVGILKKDSRLYIKFDGDELNKRYKCFKNAWVAVAIIWALVTAFVIGANFWHSGFQYAVQKITNWKNANTWVVIIIHTAGISLLAMSVAHFHDLIPISTEGNHLK
jgi:hypothetical protein